MALALLTSVLALMGCGGGGGGGGGGAAAGGGGGGGGAAVGAGAAVGGGGNNAQPVIPLGPVIAASTAEENSSYNALAPINAFVPIDLYNIRGQGQVVADFDTGADASNPDLQGQILTTQGYNEGTDQPQTISTDEDTKVAHGTAVASIIAGQIGNGLQVEGVAPDAQVVPVQMPIDPVSGSYTEIDDAHLAPAVNYFNNTLTNVHVINNSWNIAVSNTQGLSIQQFEQQNGTTLASQYQNTVRAWQTFVNNGNVVVWAAGNESAAQPDAFAGLPQEVPLLQPGWAVAIAITPTGALASYSNACGSAAAYCLAAVGGPVTVAVSPAVSANGYAVGSGTSFAAPAVSGAIALLMSAPNQHLTAQQALQILFQTANNTGVFSNSAIFGRGVLNLNAAMQPVGQEVIAAQSIDVAPLAATSMVSGGAFGAGPARALASVPIMVQDSFQRGYVVPMGAFVSPGAPSFYAPERVALFGKADRTLFDDGDTRFALVDDADPRIASPDSSGLRFVAGNRLAPGLTLQVAAGVDPARLLPSGGEGAAGDLARSTLAPGAAANPYFALMSKPMAAAADLKFGSTRVALVGAAGEPILPADITDQPGAAMPRILASDVEVEHRFAGGALARLDAGTMVESDTLLGSYGTGAAQMSRSETWFAGVGGEVPLDRGTSLVAGFHGGTTSAGGPPGSMVQGAGDIASFAAGLGVVGHDWLRDGDKMTLGVALPLRAVSGHTELLVPTTVAADGSVTSRPVSVGMNADGSEVDLQAAWTVPVREQAHVTTGLLLRRDPDNIRGAPAQAIAAVRVDYRF